MRAGRALVDTPAVRSVGAPSCTVASTTTSWPTSESPWRAVMALLAVAHVWRCPSAATTSGDGEPGPLDRAVDARKRIHHCDTNVTRLAYLALHLPV